MPQTGYRNPQSLKLLTNNYVKEKMRAERSEQTDFSFKKSPRFFKKNLSLNSGESLEKVCNESDKESIKDIRKLSISDGILECGEEEEDDDEIVLNISGSSDLDENNFESSNEGLKLSKTKSNPQQDIVSGNIVKVCPISLNKEYNSEYEDLILKSDNCEDDMGYHYYVLNADPRELNIRVTPKSLIPNLTAVFNCEKLA
ncbi:unnamed protein product [Moneuplotes crassus]|uniref:Uncharacterized protein n=1 Tax=Euplotes crassus TaxID=5936 RepID=A0AAD2D2P2_EUPCR|nr:unnamed protein product [Moneuplotes crassus]